MDAQTVFAVLVRQLLQVSLVALVVWAVVRWKAKDRPHLAHALWAIVAIKCVTPPIIASPVGVFCWTELFTAKPLTAAHVPPHTHQLDLQPVPSPLSLPMDPSLGRGQHSLDSVATVATVATPRSAALPQSIPRTSQPLEPSTSNRVITFLLFTWLAGTVIGLMTAAGRLASFLRRVRRDTIDTPRHIAALTDRLSKQLQVRRNVRVRIVNSPIGPAVVGLLRPTILLPQLFIEHKSEKQIAPLLAHELIHIRRGDLYWSLLQTVASRCWWFHPLVVFAGRMLGREAERSCDEETIRGLGCKPAEYARGLLDILEQKQRLHIAPALPGVRPADITKKRLERIMRLEHGCHARTPRWVSLVMLAALAIALPGAAWVVGQDDTAQPFNTTLANPAAINTAVSSQPMSWKTTAADSAALPQPLEEIVPTIVEVDARAALERIVREEQVTREEAERYLQAFVWMLVPQASDKQSYVSDSTDSREGHTIVLGGTEPAMKYFGDRMFVLSAPQFHARVQQIVDRVARHGTRQLVVSTRIISVPAERFAKLDLNWTIAANARDTTASHAAAARLHGTSTSGDASVRGWVVPDTVSPPALPWEFQDVADQSPTLMSVLDRTAAKKLIEEAQRDRRANILQAPKVTVFNGQDATIIDAVQRPFVVSVAEKTLEPILRTVSEGLRLRIQPVFDDSVDEIKLTCDILLNEITEVNTLTFKHESSPSNGGVTLQVPQIAAQRLAVNNLTIPTASSLLVAGVPATQGKQKMIMMAMIEVDVLDSDQIRQASTTENTAPTAQTEPKANPASATPVPDIVIEAKSSSDSAAPAAALIAALHTAGFETPVVRGNIEFTITNGNLVVRGDQLKISDSEAAEEFVLRGDRGEVTFANGTSSASFVGNAAFRCDGLEASANEIRNESNKWQLRGNARLVCNEVQIEAAEITLDQDSGSITTSGQTKFKSLLRDKKQD